MERNLNGLPEAGRECEVTQAMSLGDKPIAYAYVPIQSFRMMYSVPEALSHGTLFEELYKPMEVYGNE